MRSRGKKVISVAWTGIASTLLINGQTASSVFQLPFDLNETSNSSMKFNSKKAKALSETDVFFWDEGPMAPLDALNATDRLLTRLSTQGLEQLAFGGKIMVLGGDFRQVPPVVNHGSETQIVENSIRSGKIWKSFKRLKLTINMRAGQG